MRFLEIADTVDKNNTRLYNTDMTKINPRTEIYVDMDGVLVDFFKAWADIMGVKSFRDIKKNWPKRIPSSIIHGDLFIDNIFFHKGKFGGFIDFYFSAYDFQAYELAICINSLCFNKTKNKFKFNKKKASKLFKGYESIRKLKPEEKRSMKILCKGSALRYLATRKYDYVNTPKNILIKKKDPSEYI